MEQKEQKEINYLGKKAKILFVLVDGIGDLQLKQLDNKTCLQYGKLPIFDAIAKSGINGIMDPVEAGLSCGSDTAHMNIFGYNPFKLYKGRGSFETMGSGLDMDPSEIAFKCNFAHQDENQIVKKRRVDREFPKWGLPLMEHLDNYVIKGDEDYYIRVKHATEHRCGVKISCKNKNCKLTNQITGTDPLKDNLKLRKVQPKDPKDEKSVFTAKLVNNLSDQIHEQLENHPINLKRKAENKLTGNIVLLRGCGERLDVETFYQKHGKKGFMIAPTAIIKGLGQTINLDIIDVEGATGDYTSNYNNKVLAAVKQFNSDKNYDFGFLHIKGVDDAGHDKSVTRKIEQLEKVNTMFETLLQQEQNQDYETIICLTGDHTTPVIYGDHTFEPVPVTISTLTAMKLSLQQIQEEQINKEYLKKLQIFKDLVQNYSEVDAGKNGVLGRFPACQLLQTLWKFQNKITQN